MASISPSTLLISTFRSTRELQILSSWAAASNKGHPKICKRKQPPPSEGRQAPSEDFASGDLRPLFLPPPREGKPPPRTLRTPIYALALSFVSQTLSPPRKA